jgi:hypothetical protein
MNDKPVETTQEIIPKEQKVITREDLINMLMLNINKAIVGTFGKEYLGPDECDVIRIAMKGIDKRLKRWMRRATGGK